MSTFFKTWDEVAEYVNANKGYEYLDNPSSWIDAFKETVGNTARYVGENTFYNPDGFYALDNWITQGKPTVIGLETGSTSLPSVTNVITDTTTGATVAGAAAAATEAVGTTITLTAAGWLATGLVGLGLGVAAYEAAPEFWTDLSNAVFEPITGEHLTPEQTEPFLRRKIKTLLSTNEYHHLVTYIDKDMLERMYNFIQSHLREDGWAFYDLGSPYTAGGDWTLVSPASDTSGLSERKGHARNSPTIDIPVTLNGSLTDGMLQANIHQVQIMMESAGYSESEPSAAGIINDLHNQYPNYNNADFYAVYYVNSYTSPTVQTRLLQITGYTCVTDENNRITAKIKQDSSFSDWYYRWLRLGVSESTAENNDYGTKVNLYDANNNIINNSNILFTYQYDLTEGVGNAKDDGTSYIFQTGFWLGYNFGNDRGYYNGRGCYYTTIDPLGVLDDYLVSNGVEQKGDLPPKTGNIDQGYQDWMGKAVKVGQPTKNGGNSVSTYVPANAPISDADTDKIINNGVNKGPGSYTDNQGNTQQGQDTPNRNPIDDFNDDIDDNIKDYNDSQIDPFTAPEPAPQPLPSYPVDPPTDTNGDSGDSPTPSGMTSVTASGMVSVYNPTKQQLIDFSAWLWSPSFLDNFLKIFANPMDAIIGLHIMYATPVSSGSEHIVCGYLDSNVSSKVVTQQYSSVNCGTINIPEYYGNAIDYEPYTTVHIYLPFVGIVPLKANDVIGKQLTVKYGVDAMTGTCLAMLTTTKGSSDITCYTFAGNCATQIPISGGNYGQMITGLAGFLTAGIGAVATGNPLMALGAGAAFMSGNVSVQHSGAIGSNAGASGIRTPYVIITRKKAYNATNYQKYYGLPANKETTLSACRGYTKVKSVHIENMLTATDNEKTEIETLLRDGIIIQ